MLGGGERGEGGEISDVGRKRERQGGQQRAGGTHVAVDDGRLVQMQVLQPARDVEHELDLRGLGGEREGKVVNGGDSRRSKGQGQRGGGTHDNLLARRGHVADVVEQVAVLAELADHHDGRPAVFGDRHAEKLDNVGVLKVGQQLELLDVHLAELAAELCDRDLEPAAELADVDVLEPARANLLHLDELGRRDLLVLEPERLEVEVELLGRERLVRVPGRRRRGRRVRLLLVDVVATEQRRRHLGVGRERRVVGVQPAAAAAAALAPAAGRRRRARRRRGSDGRARVTGARAGRRRLRRRGGRVVAAEGAVSLSTGKAEDERVQVSQRVLLLKDNDEWAANAPSR